MNDRNLYRAMLLAFALVTAVHAASSDAALPATGAGALDPTFGNGNGVVTTTASNGNWSVGAVLQGDGKFVVSSAIESKNGTFTFALMRYLDNGALDPSFASGGIGTYPMSPNDGPGQYGAAIDAAGRVIVTGAIQPDANYRCAIIAVMPDGKLDTTFGVNGLAQFRLNPGKNAFCTGAAIQPDGGIIAYGFQRTPSSDYEAFVVRHTSQGQLDTTFNGQGYIALQSPNGFIANGIFGAPDGSLLLSGATSVKPRNGILIKMRADGTLDSGFANGGRFTSSVPGGVGVEFYGVAVQPDGRIVIVGGRGDTTLLPMIARLTATGTPDASFGAGGYLDLSVNGYPGFARNVAVQRDGKYAIEARVVVPGNAVRFAVARTHSTGAPDTGFGTGGATVLPAFAVGNDYSYGMAMGADGKIWVAGHSTMAGSIGVAAVARILGDEITSPIVEFHNSALDHYFITADPNEASAIDGGTAGPGWTRTGQSWKSGGPSRVCRFYGSPEIDPATSQRRGPNGHFYTISADECALVKEDAGWKFESYDFSGWKSFGGGQCAAGTIAVKRVYNNRFAMNDSNHRYATSDSIYDQMVAQGWSGEGTVFCAPL